MGQEGYSYQYIGFSDPWSEGRLGAHYAAAASRWGRANVFKTNRRKNCPISAEHFTTAQVSGSYDLNGDGLLDLIESLDGQERSSQTWDDWQVRFNTGAGFGAARPISMASHNRFMLSEVLDYCSSTSESDPSVYGGLMDLDADGLPEVYHVWGKELARSSIQMAGEAGGAGRLIAIENGYGARTTIHYANAKLDPVTTHHVPFPEIVVSHVETTVLDGSGPGLAPVHYRYGNATMAYDAMSARWTFPGYRWQLVLAGHPWTKDEVTTVTGVLTRYEYDEQAAPPISQFVEKVVRGRLAKVSRLEGSFDLPSLHQFLPPANGAPFAETTFTYAVRKEALTAEPESNLDCALDYPLGDTVTVTDLCRARGYVYQQAIRAWEGTVPSVNHSTEAGSRVLAIDAWGRPTSTHDQGDLRRTDDDVCTLITYGNGAPFPSVVTSVTLTDCIVDGTSRILARSRFLYDNQPFGSVTVGRLTQRWVDRYDATGFLGTFLDESYTYDGFGEIATAVSVRTLGGASTRTIGFVRDGFGASITSTSETASDVGRTFTKTIQASTWPSRGASSIDQAGIKTAVELDAVGRPRRETVEASGNRWTLRQITYPTDPADRKIIVDTFPGNTLAGSEASAPRQRTTTLLDALGRARFTQSELGSSYAQQTIVSDLVYRDDLGRVAFVAAPFAASAQLFDPGSPAFLPYGTSVRYDARGRTTKVVEANGWNDGATATSVAGKVYVSTTSYQYAQGQSVVGTRGADANDPSSPRFGHVDQAYRSALGRETRRVRKDAAGAMLDVIDQTFDRLGRVTMTTRYGDPTSMTGVTVWKSHYDSLGRRLRLDEPSVAPMISTFDEDGNELETAWQDGTTRRVTRTAYDGFGRVTSQTLASTLIGQPETVESHDLYHYDVRAGDGDEPYTDGSVLLGRLAWAENAAVGKVYFGYDGFGRGNAEVYEYSGHGVVRQQSVLTTGGVPTSLTLTTPQTTDVISYVHDSAWRTRQVTKGSTALFDAVNVTALGQYETVKYGNGVIEKFTHDPVGRREQQKWMAYTAGGTYSFETLTRDGAGRVTEERHTTPTTASTYHATFDGLGRLATRLQSGGIVPGLEMFTYDGLGNFKTRTSTTGSGNRTYTTEPADRDRLCRYAPPGGSACLFKYDGAGNVTDDLTQPTARSFTYDAGQRIREITKGASKVTMTYGPVGRMKTVVGGPNARTVWRFGGAIEERKRTDGVVQIERMIGGPLGAIASLRTALNASGAPIATETIYTHGDGRANRLFTRANGAVVQAPTYASFGATTSGTSSGDPLTSTDDLWNGGDNLPEVGLVILGPRAYDPEMGRFLQRDPISIVSRSTTGNPYAFAFSDPINYADPTGLSPFMTIWQSISGGGGGGSSFSVGAIAATNIGYSLAKHILDGDGDSDGPHAAVGVGASQWKGPAGGVLFQSGRVCSGATCYLGAFERFGSWGQMQIGMFAGGYDVAHGLVTAVKSIPGCLDPQAACSGKMIIGLAQRQLSMLRDPRGTFCVGGCVQGITRFATRETINILGPKALGAAWSTFSRLRTIGVAPKTVPSSGGGSVSLYRAVGDAELQVIESTGRIPPSLSGLEVKYFSSTPQGAASYARQAVKGFGDAPYTLVETQIPRSALPADVLLQVDRSVPAVVLPNTHLPLLGPARVWPFMPLP